MENDARSRGIDPSYLEVAVRAWAFRSADIDEDGTPTLDRPGSERRYPAHWLIFDTETTVDVSQRLLIGAWRLCRTDETDPLRPRLECVEEGVFYPDDIADWKPDAAQVLSDLESEHPKALDVVDDHITNPKLCVVGQREFLDRTLWRGAWKLRAGVVCFNSPFDLSRIAWRAGEARIGKRARKTGRYDAYAGGFSFVIWQSGQAGIEKRENRFRPRIAIKSIDSKRALKGFRVPDDIDEIDLIPGDGQAEPDEGFHWRGEFLDLRTLTFALTDRGHTLESACDAFDVPYTKRDVKHGQVTREYIEYCREDALATQKLCERTVHEFLRHPVPLMATAAFSPATIGRSYLKTMGITPPRKKQKWDPRFLGWAMSAYYGGRSECRIRRTPVPVVYCDFLSMYPTVCTLMGVWKLLTAQTINVVDRTTEISELLDGLTAEHCLAPESWPKLVGIARVIPDGDILPVRASYGAGPGYQIGVNPLHSDQPFWYTLADLAASKLLTGRAPKIERAYALVPFSELSGMSSINLLREVRIDPAEGDFFRSIIERRKAAQAAGDEQLAKSLKVLANSTSYGIYAQMTRHELPADQTVPVTVYAGEAEPTRFRIRNPEDPGEYCFPPIAATITGSARLMLAILERLITDNGGSYAFCDTDSMAIVSTENGGPTPCPGGSVQTSDGEPAVRALSWQQVEEIREQFTQLNPYSTPETSGSLLELEAENYNEHKQRHQLWCYAISAKRYALYTKSDENTVHLSGVSGEDENEDHEDSEPALRKPSQHGLGHLLNPIDPEDDSRDWIGDVWTQIITRRDQLSWAARPAVARTSVSTPSVRRLFQTLNGDKPYAGQIKPFNFLNVAFVDAVERPAADEPVVLVAPYERNPRRWPQQVWTNRFNGRPYRITTEPSQGLVRDGVVTVKTYHATILDYATHPEPKSLSADGAPCGRRTIGLLRRRSVTPTIVQLIGKESNRLEDARVGLLDDGDEPLNLYSDRRLSVFDELVAPVLRDLGIRETARRTGHGLGSVSAAVNRRSTPRPAAIARYFDVAVEHAHDLLVANGVHAEVSDQRKLKQAALLITERTGAGWEPSPLGHL
ncbi:MAG: hypothetical protein ACR2ND_05075 [Solirubrobacteraceae bacterium]